MKVQNSGWKNVYNIFEPSERKISGSLDTSVLIDTIHALNLYEAVKLAIDKYTKKQISIRGPLYAIDIKEGQVFSEDELNELKGMDDHHKVNCLPSDDNPILIKELTKICKKEGLDLRIYYGKEKKIFLIEEIMQIGQSDMVLFVYITNISELEWVKDQLDHMKENSASWYTEDTYADRKMINERYGF